MDNDTAKTGMKLYMASLYAQQSFPEMVFKKCHVPGWLEGRTIEEAAELAREVAFASWPIADGWSHHGANIKPLPGTPEFLEAVKRSVDARASDPDDEGGGKAFNFDPDAKEPKRVLRPDEWPDDLTG